MSCARLLKDLTTKPLCAAVVLVSLSFPAFCQDRETRNGNAEDETPGAARVVELNSEVARLLQSPAKKDRAWAAYLIGRHGLKNHTTSLRALLEITSPNSDEESACLQRALLDALIQLGADVPAESLQLLYHEFPVEVIILLAKEPANNQAVLLSLFAEPSTNQSEVRWLAIANLLTETRTPGFAASLLRGMKIDVYLHVFTSEPEGHGHGGESGGVRVGYGRAFWKPKGFPPIALYELVGEAERGAAVVAPGPHPIYYKRWVTGDDGRADTHHSEGRGNLDRLRLEYLTELLRGRAELIEFELAPNSVVVWKVPRLYLREVRRIRKEIKNAYDDIVSRLLKIELLSEEEAATLTPNTLFHVYDERLDKSLQIPELHDQAKSPVE